MEIEPLIYPNNKINCKYVILIEKTVPDCMTFYNSCNSDTFPIIYSTNSTRDIVVNILQNFTNIERLSLCFINDSFDKLFLNNQSIFDKENFDFILNIIIKFSVQRIDYLACNLLSNSNYVNYFNSINNYSNVIIGASNDKTGNLKYGGNWVLESTNENIQNTYFDNNILNYSHLLDTAAHFMVLKNDGTLYATGWNGSGQLGLGNTTTYTSYTKVTNNISNKLISMVSLGYGHSAILTTDNKIYVTGNIVYGQLGLGYYGVTPVTSFQLVNTSNISGLIKSVSCGHLQTFILTYEGKLYSCGMNDNGELGLGDKTLRTTFTLVSNLPIYNKFVTDIRSGSSYSIALTSDGKVFATGSVSSGRSGVYQTSNDNLSFIEIGYNLTGEKIVQIACGTDFTYALSNNGKVFVTGNNSFGQLGLNDLVVRNTFFMVDNVYYLSPIANKIVIKIACGSSHGALLTSDGLLYTTGTNVNGQLGMGNFTDLKSFTLVNFSAITTSPIAHIFCIESVTLVITQNGKMYVTGKNGGGQLGIGITPDKNIFTEVTSLTGLVNKYNDIISNICFVAGSIVSTDQGLKRIEKINPSLHTINGKPILYVTETYTIDEHLVCINKHALGKNIPNKKTIVSKNHLIMYNKKLIEAKDLVYLNNSVEFVENTGELLYNLLLEKHSLMNVNNLTTETLDPKNIIAKSYLGQMTEEEKTILLNNNYQHLDKLDKIRNKKNVVKM